MIRRGRAILLLPLVATAPVIASGTSESSAGAVGVAQEQSDSLRLLAAHLLNRLAFGASERGVDEVIATGPRTWIDAQLSSDTSLDVATLEALRWCGSFTGSAEAAVLQLSGPEVYESVMTPTGRSSRVFMYEFPPVVTRDSASRIGTLEAAVLSSNRLLACQLTRMERSASQLLEVMTNFWENHFSVHSLRLPSRGSFVELDRVVVRPRALGRFRELLGAVAHSPAMLAYLDNTQSSADEEHPTLAEMEAERKQGRRAPRRATGLNENFARELLELHTLGVDAGYTQMDVIEVARAFTGWTHTSAPTPDILAGTRNSDLKRVPLTFHFDSARHDAGPKTILGVSLPSGRGLEDGEAALDILARHPSTARHIARKLAVRFVSDTPSEALVARAAQTFLDTDGDIREVVRRIVTDAEFLSPRSYGAKVKSPLELVLSIRRVLGAPPDTAAEQVDMLVEMEQPPLGRASPDGWPETASSWLNVGAMRTRIEIAQRVARGDYASIPVQQWSGWNALVHADFEAQVNGVAGSILGGSASSSTLAAMRRVKGIAGEKHAVAGREEILRELIGLALASPEFQRR